MCLNPILLPNPYYHGNRGTSHIKSDGSKGYLDFNGKFDYLHDTIHKYVSRPCGQCSQCLSMRQNYYVQRIQMESLRSELFFFTLTYADRALKYSTDREYRIPYPYYKDIQNMWKRLRQDLPHPIRTFVVSEYGSKRHRPHYHGFIAVSKDDIKKYYRGSYLYCEKVLFRMVLSEWKRKVGGSKRNPIYMNLLDFIVKGQNHTYELHWVQPIINHDNDISYYVTKYLLKYQDWCTKLLTKISLDPRLSSTHTKLLISQIKPRAVMSKDFGDYSYPDISQHIKYCLSRSPDVPQFFDINTGKSMLLSPYYRKHHTDIEYYFDRYWDYLLKVQNKNITSLCGDSYNPEYLNDDTVSEINSRSSKSRYKDLHLIKTKHLLTKKH